MVFLSIFIGWIDCLIGLAMSYQLNVPSGASIIFSGIVVYAMLRAVKALCAKAK
jgi:zinc transport system permease protein